MCQVLLLMTHCNLICEIDFIPFTFAIQILPIVAVAIANQFNKKYDAFVLFCFVLF